MPFTLFRRLASCVQRTEAPLCHINTPEGHNRILNTALPSGSITLSTTAVWKVAYVFVIILYAWLRLSVPIYAIPAAGHDDGLFVYQARQLIVGEWLGPYNNLTLAKGAFYPMWIAVNWIVGLPILVSQGLFYALACLFLVRGLRPWLRWEAATFTVFLILLFNPAMHITENLRIMREAVYVPLTISIFAGALWWFRWRHRGLLRRATLAIGLGTLLAAFWLTREEGLWIAPALLLVFCIAVLDEVMNALRSVSGEQRGRLRACLSGAMRAVTLAGLVAAVAALGVGAVGWMNQKKYGVTDTVEFKQHEFLSAYGALSRIHHRDGQKPYVVIPREVLEQVYPLSSAAAELQPFFDSSRPDAFIQVGCQTYAIAPCDGEIRAGWFIWALRDAVAHAGYYRSATEARAFYARMAEEINAACEDGRLECLPPRATMAPPFRVDYVWPTLRTMAIMIKSVATFFPTSVPHNPRSCAVDSCGQSLLYQTFLDIVRTDLFTHPPSLAGPDFQNRSADGGSLPFQMRSNRITSVLEKVLVSYRIVLPWILIAAAIAYVGTVVRMVQRRVVEPLFLVATVAAVLVMTRIFLLSYLDVVAIPSMSPLYNAPTFPALLVFCTTAIAAASRLYDRRNDEVPTDLPSASVIG